MLEGVGVCVAVAVDVAVLVGCGVCVSVAVRVGRGVLVGRGVAVAVTVAVAGENASIAPATAALQTNPIQQTPLSSTIRTMAARRRLAFAQSRNRCNTFKRLCLPSQLPHRTALTSGQADPLPPTTNDADAAPSCASTVTTATVRPMVTPSSRWQIYAVAGVLPMSPGSFLASSSCFLSFVQASAISRSRF